MRVEYLVVVERHPLKQEYFVFEYLPNGGYDWCLFGLEQLIEDKKDYLKQLYR